VPTTYQRLLEYKAVAGLNTLPRGRLRGLYVAGAPLDPTLKQAIETEFGPSSAQRLRHHRVRAGISGVRRCKRCAPTTSVGSILPAYRVAARSASRQARWPHGEASVNCTCAP